MDVRKPVNIEASGLMLFVTLIWGLQQVAIKYSAADMAPIFQIAFRSGCAFLCVILFVWARRQLATFHKGVQLQGIIAGILFSLEYFFVGKGLKYSTASHIIIFFYTAPIFAAIGLNYFLPTEKLAPLQWIGIIIAFLGIITAFYIPIHHSDHNVILMLYGDILGLIGGLCWGATTVLIRVTKLAACPAAQTLLYQLITAFILLSIIAAILHETHIHWQWRLILSLSYQVIALSFISFLLWFWLLRVYLATQLGILSLMTPLFGITFSIILLKESLSSHFIVGALFVIAGIFIVSAYPWLRIKYTRWKDIKQS